MDDTMNELATKQSTLNPAIRRFIKREEQYLGRTCRKIWTFKSKTKQVYLMGSFCKNHDRLFVTIGHYDSCVMGGFIPSGV